MPVVRFTAALAVALSVATITALGSTVQPLAALSPDVVHLTASGDFSSNNNTAATLAKVASLAPDFHVALGDLSYGATGAEQAWCDFVTSRVGAGFPFELISGNHESNGQNGNINDFAACLPNQLPGVVGTYGRQYYVDVPKGAPLVRVIAISPGLTYPDGAWNYAVGSARYQWTAAAIDAARSVGIPWVIVAMHKPCVSVGEYGCDAGTDLVNLLIQKRVDLVLTGHEHLYQRTKQLISGTTGCPVLAVNGYNPGCVADADNALAQGAGTVFATVGTGGQALRNVDLTDTEAGYFAATSGLNMNPTWGVLDVSMTANSLTAEFVGASGGTFTDAFAITAGAQPNALPTALISKSCTDLMCTFDGSASSDPDGQITGYQWQFGDGSVATGASTGHSYAAAGTYTTTLTVTDNQGGTHTATTTFAVTAPPGSGAIASDTFSRQIVNALGTADVGGAWTTSGAVSAFSVSGGVGRIRMSAAGGTLSALLDGVSVPSGDLRLMISIDQAATGGGVQVAPIVRRVSGVGSYQATVVFRTGGAVTVCLVRTNAAGVGTSLSSTINVPGVTYVTGDRLNVRVRAVGASPTALAVRVWKVGSPEPSTWHLTATDATAGLQVPGSVGLRTYLSSSATTLPVTASIDELLVTAP
ncbi:MAG TPA: PKD domain-containing protein [Candidatus Lumbricidophila sp.]|nr:PKD domain-containing protein [Candidatus Lumbricidophila sp.]